MNASQALALLLNVLYDARRIPRHEGVTYAKNDAKKYVGPILTVYRRVWNRIAAGRSECGG
jgi:hypothetical protein